MALETGTYISDLVSTNPVGATDPKSQGDDHIRLIKATLLATFPSITGAVTATHSELNILDGVTLSATQINNALVKTESSIVSGSIEVTDTSGDNLGALRVVRAFPVIGLHETGASADEGKWQVGGFAGVLDFRTLDDAESGSVSALRIIRGTGTAVDEIELNATTIDINGDVDISSTLSVNSSSNFYDRVNFSDTQPVIVLNDTDGGTDAKKWLLRAEPNELRLYTWNDSESGATNPFKVVRSGITPTEVELNATTLDFNGTLDLDGSGNHSLITSAGFIELSGSNVRFRDGTAARFLDATNSDNVDVYHDGTDFRIVGGSGTADLRLTGFTALDAGSLTVTTSNSSASEVGYKGVPSVDISSSTNTSASTSGQCVRLTGGSGQTFTFDADPPEDSVIVIDNASGNDWTLAATTTLIWALDGSTGNRTLADDGLAVALHRGSGVWVITGGGLS